MRENTNGHKMLLYIIVVLIIITLTRFLAYFGLYYIKLNEIPIIKDVIHLTYVENTGAAFGMLKDAKLLLIFISIALFIAITYYVAYKNKTEKKLTTDIIVALALIAGGGISNVADRFTFGFVVDYVNFKIINFAVFNLADTCVTLGAVYIGLKVFFSKEDKS